MGCAEAANGFFHSRLPSWARRQRASLERPLSTALVKKIFSPQRTGCEWPTPGSSTFQFWSASVHCTGIESASLNREPLGPRKRVHPCAGPDFAAEKEKTNT